MSDIILTEADLEDINVEYEDILSPEELAAEIPFLYPALQTVKDGRKSIEAILNREDTRMFLVVGPCSTHNVDEAREYSRLLKQLADEVIDQFVIVKREYFQKPRTNLGWQGLVSDPHMDASFDIEEGYRQARELLLYNAELGLFSGTEFMDAYAPQYLGVGISWAAIGARSSEDQSHRNMGSALSMPVGYKNDTSGNIDTAINALQVAIRFSSFLGPDPSNRIRKVNTRGNQYCHVILRGGRDGPNYSEESVHEVQAKLEVLGLPPVVVIDCSHENSQNRDGEKDYKRQPKIFDDIVRQRRDGNTRIIGSMIESNKYRGKQSIPYDLRGFDRSTLEPGKSVTDGCIDWEETIRAIKKGYHALTTTTVGYGSKAV